MGVIVWSPLAGGWLSGAGATRRGLAVAPGGAHPARFDLSLPANQAKLDAAGRAGGAGREARIHPIHLALAFVIDHPAVTAAIIGPRTMEQLESQLGAADVELDDARARPDRRDRAARHEPEPSRRRLTPPSLDDPAQRRR